MKVESFEAAVQWLKDNLNKDYSTLPGVEGIPVDMSKAVVSNYKLWVIALAAREAKKLNRGFYPYWWMDRAGSGSGFSFGGSFCDYDYSTVGARLEYPDGKSSDYHAQQHKELYKDVFVITEE